MKIFFQFYLNFLHFCCFFLLQTLTIPTALLPKTEPEVKSDIIDVVGSPSMPNVGH